MSEVELEAELEPSSSNAVEVVQKDDLSEPEAKRRRISKYERKSSDKLEYRLGGILCCAVCLDLPRAAVYQCGNGHLMCAGCFTHVLADSRLRDETATCPNCRVEISKDSASRNLAVENAISELPSECKFCSKEFSRNTLDRHQDNLCDERFNQITVSSEGSHDVSMGGLVRRAAMFCVMFVNMLRKPKNGSSMFGTNQNHVRLVTCEYACIGCPWRGPHHERAPHEAVCLHPRRSGAEVMAALQSTERAHLHERQLLDTLFQLLCFEKITFNDLQFKPYRTEEYVNRLFYETTRFSAFNNQWVVKAHINNSQRDPTQSSERDIAYQIILKSKPQNPLSLHYVILRGPFGDMRSSPRIYQFEFNERDAESTPTILPLPDTTECNRLLANKTINFRLIMFLISK